MKNSAADSQQKNPPRPKSKWAERWECEKKWPVLTQMLLSDDPLPKQDAALLRVNGCASTLKSSQ